jgi:hypothetical protein
VIIRTSEILGRTTELGTEIFSEVLVQKFSLMILFLFTKGKKPVSLFLAAAIIIYVKFTHHRPKYGTEANYFPMQHPY